MASQTDICNMALLKIGEKTISEISEDSVMANKLRAVYGIVLDEVLVIGPEKGWKFARKKVAVSVDADSPDSEYDYRYAIPVDCLRLVRVHLDGEDITDWKREGQYIYTNMEDSEVDLDYVSRVEVTGLFPPHFTKVLYTALAYHLAFNVIQSKSHTNSLFEEFHFKVLPTAIGMDEQEKYQQEESSAWVDIGRTTTTIE